MGLKPTTRKGAESPKRARIEGERTLKKSPERKSRSRSQDSKSGSVRFFESGNLKRKGESLVSDVPKQARRSPRVQTQRQKEAKLSRVSRSEQQSGDRRPKSTRSLASIFQKESVKLTDEKNKEAAEKSKPQSQKPQRLRKMSAQKGGNVSVDTSSKEDRQEENVSVSTEIRLEESVVAAEDSHAMTDNPEFEEVVPTPYQSSLVSKHFATSIAGQKVKQTVLDVMTNVPSQYLRFRREGLAIRLVVREEKKTKSIIIRDQPKRVVRAYFKSVEFAKCSLHLLDSGYRNFYDQLKRISREPYPPESSAERHTLHPIMDTTVIKVVPDLQPPNFVEPQYEKLKLKVHPESLLDDMSSDQIAEEMRLIDAACEEKRSASSICVYQDPGTSHSKATVDDPQGGLIRNRQYNPLKIGVLECSYVVMKIILLNRPLWEITSVGEVMPWLGRPLLRLPVPFDIDIPDQLLDVPPPLLQVIEPPVSNKDAYTTTVVSVVAPPIETKPSTAAAPPTLEQQVQTLVKDMKKVKKMLKKLLQQSGK